MLKHTFLKSVYELSYIKIWLCRCCTTVFSNWQSLFQLFLFLKRTVLLHVSFQLFFLGSPNKFFPIPFHIMSDPGNTVRPFARAAVMEKRSNIYFPASLCGVRSAEACCFHWSGETVLWKVLANWHFCERTKQAALHPTHIAYVCHCEHYRAFFLSPQVNIGEVMTDPN